MIKHFLRGYSRLNWYLKSLMLWNPLITLGFCLLSGPRNLQALLLNWAIALYIATIVTNVCFGATQLAQYINQRLAKRYPKISTKRSISWYFAVAFLAMPLGLYLAFASLTLWDPLLSPQGVHLGEITSKSYRAGLVWGSFIALIFFLYRTQIEARETAQRNEQTIQQLQNKQLQTQIAALTAQMNPHFLFNALNTVAALIPMAPEKAEHVLLQLADLYRSVLDASRQITHTLAAELTLCRTYLAIEQARFGEQLSWEIHSEPDLDPHSIRVPTLCLQPLIENAINHGLRSQATLGKIAIFTERHGENLQLRVEDNGVGTKFSSKQPSPHPDSPSYGLQNLRERLLLCYGGNSRLRVEDRPGGGTQVVLEWPLYAALNDHELPENATTTTDRYRG